MKYTLPSKAREFVLFQRTTLLPKRKAPNRLIRILQRLKFFDNGYEKFVREYALEEPELIDERYFQDMSSLAETLLPYIPKTTRSILDIGCGIAGLDLFLNEKLDSPTLFLLDKTAIEDKVWYDFKQEGAFYNSLELAKETLVSNGVSADQIECLDAPEDGVINLPSKSIDLVVSTISWGFHYPVATYLHSVSQILSDEGVLLLDIRKGAGGEAELEKYFTIKTIQERVKHNTIKATQKQ